MSTFVRTVNCFGDSFAYGYGDRETYLGWAGRLRQYFHRINEVDGVEYEGLAAFHNLSLLGDTAAKIYDRVARERSVRRGRAVLNILSVGLNDSAIRSDGSQFAQEDEFQDTLQRIYDILTEDNCTAMYVGHTSFDDTKTVCMRNRDVTYVKERAGHFEQLALAVTASRNITAVPLFALSDNETYLTTMLDKDGLHPNADGHAWVFEQVVEPARALMGDVE